MTRKYRKGEQQQETLRSLLSKLATQENPELFQLITVALSAEVPAQAVADAVGISYSGLLNWINDEQITVSRREHLPRIKALTAAITIGDKVGVLPTDGDHVGPVLSLLMRCVSLRDERDAARQKAAAARAIMATVGEDRLPPEIITAFDDIAA